MIPTPTPFTEITNGALSFLAGLGSLLAGVALTASFVGALLILLLPEGRREVWFVVYIGGVFIAFMLSLFVGNWWWFASAAAFMPLFLGVRWVYRRYVFSDGW